MNDFTKLFEQDDEWEKYAVQFLVKVEKEMVDAKGDVGKEKKTTPELSDKSKFFF